MTPGSWLLQLFVARCTINHRQDAKEAEAQAFIKQVKDQRERQTDRERERERGEVGVLR